MEDHVQRATPNRWFPIEFHTLLPLVHWLPPEHFRKLLVLTGRVQDNWLATWSRADAAVSHPLDPIELAEAVIRLLRSRVPAAT